MSLNPSSDQYYIKIKRRYIPVERWTGFPADGVWIVKDAMRSSRLVMRLDPRPVDHVKVVQEAIFRNRVHHAVYKALREKNLSIDDRANLVADILIKNEAHDGPF